MGSSHSQLAELSDYFPRRFYLVFGKPSVRYTRNPVRGPLIYDVDVGDEEELEVRHAQSLSLSCVVPHKQLFQLSFAAETVPEGLSLPAAAVASASASASDASSPFSPLAASVPPGGSAKANTSRRSSGCGAVAATGAMFLTFHLVGDLSRIASLAIYVGVDVAYFPAQGIQFTKAERSQPDFCVYRYERSKDSRGEGLPGCVDEKKALFQTQKAVRVKRLGTAEFNDITAVVQNKGGMNFTSRSTTSRRLTYAPIAIVMQVLEPCDTADTAAAGAGKATESNTAVRGAGGGGSRRGSDAGAAGEQMWRESREAEDSDVVFSAADQGRVVSRRNRVRSSSVQLQRSQSQTLTQEAPAAPRTRLITQFTFLDLPSELVFWDGDVEALVVPGSPPAAAVPAPTPSRRNTNSNSKDNSKDNRDKESSKAPPSKCEEFLKKARGSVAKQLVQLGAEVYELLDVFDLGDDEEAGSEEETDEDKELCIICFTNRKDTTIMPCRHMCICYECAAQLRMNNNKCPICRGNIEKVMTL